MLGKILSRFFLRKGQGSSDFNLEAKIAEANDLRDKGDLHAAMLLFRECLERDGSNVEILNGLGCCLWDVGDEHEALRFFELAYSLDDAHIPAVANYARALIDKKRTSEAISLLEHAIVCEPGFSHVYTLYASILFSRGQGEVAKDFYLQGWMGNFDSLRLANGYFFPLSYIEEDQRILAAEHRFWGETAREINLEVDRLQMAGGRSDLDPTPELPAFSEGRRIRIGYWSPDFRSHSVRYFFRPMLEGHDRERFEVFLYHDSSMSDAQTDAMKGAADHFHDVYLLNDVKLYELIRSHQLDVIVEMAGHTSANRLTLFKSNRLAALQITGVGYPPTTGLTAIDVKMLDPHIITESVSDFYTEKPLILPSSFWCFDPLEDGDVECANELPVEKNGYVTFACVGNISKISERMLSLWASILHRVPRSRLLIRSINFEDPTSKETLVSWIERAGLDMSRVDIRGAQPVAEFLRSYNDIDVVLDTFPFNGGTTSCFATYMGVPVITLVGDSLVGRMGLSIMTNLGAEHCAAYSDDDYVRQAVAVANDQVFLKDFRGRARSVYKTTALGNGRMFMAGFEAACIDLLKSKSDGTFFYDSTVAPLPQAELVRRLYSVSRAGNGDAARRILEHGLRHYPNCGGFHLYVAQNLFDQGDVAGAFSYLSARVGVFSVSDRVSALITMTGWGLLVGDDSAAEENLKLASAEHVGDQFDQMQLKLYAAVLSARVKSPEIGRRLQVSSVGGVTVLIPCDDYDQFESKRDRIAQRCIVPPGWSVKFVQCPVGDRCRYYREVMLDDSSSVMVVIQRNVEVLSADFFERLLVALSNADVIGIAGAKRWVRSHWRGDKFEQKCAGFLTEDGGRLWLQCLGTNDSEIALGQRVIDGSLLAVNCKKVGFSDFDVELSETGWAMEEDWSFGASQRGARLAVHRNLGVLISAQPESSARQRYPGLLRLQEKYKFPLFQGDRDDVMMLSAPILNADHGIQTMAVFCSTEL